MTDRLRTIPGRELIRALISAGIVSPLTTRVVIEADALDAAMIYTSTLADDRIFMVAEHVGGFEVVEASRAAVEGNERGDT